jgi:hypothetical protein
MGNKEKYQDLIEFLSSKTFDLSEAQDLILGGGLCDLCLDIALTNDEPAAWRANWILSHCMRNDVKWLIPRLSEVIRALPVIERDGHVREMLKFFGNLDFEYYPENLQGELFDICMKILENNKYQPGTRSMALKILLKFAVIEPLLLGEIKASFEFVKQFLSNGIMRSCEMKINKLELKNVNQE